MPDVRLIDANALIKDLHLMAKFQDPYKCSTILGVCFTIEARKTIDAVPVVHGRWIHCDGKSNLWYCSECGGKILYNPTRRTYNITKLPVEEMNKFCRNCGAKMDLEEEDK